MGERPLRFTFRERMVGPMARGLDNPRVGAERGRAEGTIMTLDLVVTIADLAACVAGPEHIAALSGRVSFAGLADAAAVRDGTLELYAADPETGMKQMRYRVGFAGADGIDYRLHATKFIRPRRATVREQVTAYARLFADSAGTVGSDAGAEHPGTVVAAGVVVFRLRDLASFLWSMRVDRGPRLAGLARFLAFSRRELTTSVPALAS